MIEVVVGNVLDANEGIIVHGCNVEGVMGAGIAAEVKHRFPSVYQVYMVSNRALGEISIWPDTPKKWIVNAITQDLNTKRDRTGRLVSYDAVQRCFEGVRMLQEQLVREAIILPVLFPYIGAGLGKGQWSIISEIIDTTLGPFITKRLYKLP